MSEIVAEFRGRGVPVFNDKHLSYSWEKAKQMVDWSRELSFPLQAGSSLPATWRRPDLELPLETNIEEALVLAHGGTESYGFHALETLQCHVERRAGGETGIKAVQTLTGDAVGKADDQGLWSKGLLQAALSRSRTLYVGDMRDNATEPVAFLIEYQDGLRVTVLLLNGHAMDFTFAAKIKGQSKPVSTLHYLSRPGGKFFDALVYNIERMFDAGKAVIPVGRTLLVSGTLEARMHSKFENGRRIETPHLEVAYKAPKNSGFLRGPVAPADHLEARKGRNVGAFTAGDEEWLISQPGSRAHCHCALYIPHPLTRFCPPGADR